MITVDTPFCGPLTIELVVMAQVYSSRRDHCYDADATLIDHIGWAAANNFTNFRKVSITIDPSEWRVLEFAPERNLLRAEYVGEEDITDLPDQSEFMSEVFGLDSEIPPEEDDSPKPIVN